MIYYEDVGFEIKHMNFSRLISPFYRQIGTKVTLGHIFICYILVFMFKFDQKIV